MGIKFQYEALENDTLETIAERYYSNRDCAKQLAEFNQIDLSENIRGTVLNLPHYLYMSSEPSNGSVSVNRSFLALPEHPRGASGSFDRIPLGDLLNNQALLNALEALAVQIDQAESNLESQGYTQHEPHAWLYVNNYAKAFNADVKNLFIKTIEEVDDAPNETRPYRWEMNLWPDFDEKTIGMIHGHHDGIAALTCADISYLAYQLKTNNINTDYGIIIAVNAQKIAGYAGRPDQNKTTGRHVFPSDLLQSFGGREPSFYTSNPDISQGGGVPWYFERS